MFDDGDRDTRVEAHNIRALEDRPGSAKKPERLREGDKIEGNYRMKGRWYPGKIARERADGTFDLDDCRRERRPCVSSVCSGSHTRTRTHTRTVIAQYDDGEKEYRVEKDNVRALGGAGADTPEPTLREGDRCEGNHRGRGRWYPGKIGRVHADGTYTVDYDDGEQERRIDAAMVRAIGGAGPGSPKKQKLREGDRVEGNHCGDALLYGLWPVR